MRGKAHPQSRRAVIYIWCIYGWPVEQQHFPSQKSWRKPKALFLSLPPRWLHRKSSKVIRHPHTHTTSVHATRPEFAAPGRCRANVRRRALYGIYQAAVCWHPPLHRRTCKLRLTTQQCGSTSTRARPEMTRPIERANSPVAVVNPQHSKHLARSDRAALSREQRDERNGKGRRK